MFAPVDMAGLSGSQATITQEASAVQSAYQKLDSGQRLSEEDKTAVKKFISERLGISDSSITLVATRNDLDGTPLMAGTIQVANASGGSTHVTFGLDRNKPDSIYIGRESVFSTFNQNNLMKSGSYLGDEKATELFKIISERMAMTDVDTAREACLATRVIGGVPYVVMSSMGIDPFRRNPNGFAVPVSAGERDDVSVFSLKDGELAEVPITDIRRFNTQAYLDRARERGDSALKKPDCNFEVDAGGHTFSLSITAEAIAAKEAAIKKALESGEKIEGAGGPSPQ